MANTATKVSAGANHLTYLLTGDGTVAGPTLANATLLADMEPGPLHDAWNTEWTVAGVGDQAKMRNHLLGGLADGGSPNQGHTLGGCVCWIQLMVTPVDTTGQTNQIVADVDTDAVTTTKAELNIGMSDTTGQLAMLHLVHLHSTIQ